MTCWDKRELCDLNCVYATTSATADSPSLDECSAGCVTAQAECTDSPETLAYVEVGFFYDAFDAVDVRCSYVLIKQERRVNELAEEVYCRCLRNKTVVCTAVLHPGTKGPVNLQNATRTPNCGTFSPLARIPSPTTQRPPSNPTPSHPLSSPENDSYAPCP